MPKGNGKKADSFQMQTNSIENDRSHHLIDPFLPQTPLGPSTPTPERSASPAVFGSRARRPKPSIFLSWAVEPRTSFKILLLPIILYINWEFLANYIHTDISNPFQHIFLLSGHVQTSTKDDPRYQKTYWDLAFLAYYIVFFSFVRQALTTNVSRPVAKYFGLKRESKIDRFGEQTYAFFYFMFFGAWGYRVMSQLPTYWYNTQAFWAGYPEWDMKPELKRYYLMQFAYWCHQFLVLLLGLEKPRKDYRELVAHHFVTLWLAGGSYFVNMTLMGNAVYMSMDIPDAFFAFAKLLNYIQWDTAKIYAFIIFFAIWTYFRHYLNIWILWSVVYELPSVPEWTKQWNRSEGVYMPSWMQLQIFLPLLLLQFLNLFWYYLILKILHRAVFTRTADDDRSDDEEEVEPSDDKED